MAWRHRWFLLLALVAGPVAAGDDPAVARLSVFLDAHGHQDGLPDAAGADAMRPWLSEGLAADLLVARMAQADFQRDHPDEKPPLVEGPLFNASAYEPYTAYAIEPGPAVPAAEGARRTLRVRFTDAAATPPVTWTDAFELVHEDGAWRVDDVHYGAGFAYGHRGSLRAALRAETVDAGAAGVPDADAHAAPVADPDVEAAPREGERGTGDDPAPPPA